MKKEIWLSLGALILVGIIVFAIWYINETREMRAGNKDAFIPYNSAVVIRVNEKPVFSPKVLHAFEKEINRYQKSLLVQVTDSLREQGYIVSYPYTIAVRIQGKGEITSLYVMDNKNVLSRNEMVDFLNQTFATGIEKMRKYDRYKIYTLNRQKEVVYFAICGGFVLISDSDLYIEDALKQFDSENTKEQAKPRYQHLNKYFSVGAGINIFLNTTAFTNLFPLYVQTKKMFPHLDITHLFKWGTLDGEWSTDGLFLNGFMHYEEQEKSYIQTLASQQPCHSNIETIVPVDLAALGLLSLSDVSAYLSALDTYRYSAGTKNNVHIRKQQYVKMFGKTHETDIQQLLQGEFAIAELGYQVKNQEIDGLIVTALKSGSLGRDLLVKMMQNYARFDGKEIDDYVREYRIDQQKTFYYYRFPVDDMPVVYWGEFFSGVKSRYVLVEDNYWIFASSESAIKKFIRDYVHGTSIREVDWYNNLKNKLAGKYNLSYFAKTGAILPLYRELFLGKVQQFLTDRMETSPAFPSWALQWSNEGNMLYNTIFLNSAPIQDEIQTHVVWQTRLGGKVSMKPVPVVNHVTGERELFVQDEQNVIYLINDVGRILWQVSIDEKINSDVYQVDLFKNGKLQYLFSTPTKMHLIDRNGHVVKQFPVHFRARCEQGISVYDYDNKKDYRIFVPCVDREVYLYGLDGRLVEGWSPKKTDNQIVSKVRHFRIEGKDYLTFADNYRLYILDRKGKERVAVNSVFDLPVETDIYLVQKNGRANLVFTGKHGNIYRVDFTGKTSLFKINGVENDSRMNLADVNGDGTEECILVDGNRFWVVQLDGKVLSTREIEAEALGFPYVYQFSKKDLRVGLTDKKRAQMLLLNPDGTLAKGFPIAGDSPFSIIFSENDGFFLFAGADNGSLIKYKVQR